MTWSIVVSDNFTRANTSTGGAGNTTSVGNGWIDVVGGLYSIQSNTLYAPSGGYSGNGNALRPAGEALQDSQISAKWLWANPGPSGYQNDYGIILRQSASATTRYFLDVGINYQPGLNICTVVAGGFNVIQHVNFTTNPANGATVIATFSAVGTNPTTLTGTLVDATTGTVYGTISTTDSTAGLQTAGQQGVLSFNSGFLRLTNVTTYQQVSASIAASPSSIQNSATTTVTITGAGTAFSGSPFSVSGLTGASIASQTINSGTSATLSIVAGSTTGTLTITEAGSGTSTTVSVTAAPTISASPASLPTSATTSVAVTGTGTAFSGSPFTVSGLTGVSISSQTINSTTSAALAIVTGSTAGSCTLTDTGSGAIFTLTVAVKSVAASPTTVTTSQTTSVAITGTGTAFSGTPFTISGVSGVSISSQTINSGTSATLSIVAGSTTGTATLTDTGSGATTALTVSPANPLKIGWIGDSITNGTNGDPVAQALTVLTANGFTVTSVNRGVSGLKAADWVPGGSYLPGALTAFASAGVTIVHIMLGTNDAKGTGTAVSSYVASMTLIVGALRAAGLQVVLSKPIYTLPNAQATWMADPNGYYRTIYTAIVAALVDNVNVFQGDTGGWEFFYSNPSYLADGVHPSNGTTNNYLGGLWAGALVARWGVNALGASPIVVSKTTNLFFEGKNF